jgi:peroxiredoxin
MIIEIPNAVFKVRVGDDQPEEGGCPIGGYWEDVTTEDLFKDKKVVVFSLPGAFTPTCSSNQVPGYDSMYDEFKAAGIDDVYCISVNDSFTMNAWFDHLGVKNVKPIPDGSGIFTLGMDMLVSKDNLGFGQRSWRYAAVVNNGQIEKIFEEPGKENNCSTDPYGESSPENVMRYLKGE